MVTRCSKEGRNDERPESEEEDEKIQVSLCPRGFDFFSLYFGWVLARERQSKRGQRG